jgi:hypothetical protein
VSSVPYHRQLSGEPVTESREALPPLFKGVTMAIVHRFQDYSFDAATMQIMGEAFDRACETLGEFGRSTSIQETMAKLIVEVAKTGERDCDRLCARALEAFTAPKQSNHLAAQSPLQPTLR